MRCLCTCILAVVLLATRAQAASGKSVELIFVRQDLSTSYIERIGELFIDGYFASYVRERTPRPRPLPLLSSGNWKLQLTKDGETLSGTLSATSDASNVIQFSSEAMTVDAAAAAPFVLTRDPKGMPPSDLKKIVADIFKQLSSGAAVECDVAVSSWVDGTVIKLAAVPFFVEGVQNLADRSKLVSERLTPGLTIPDQENFLWATKSGGAISFNLPPGVSGVRVEYVTKAYPRIDTGNTSVNAPRHETEEPTHMTVKLNAFEGSEDYISTKEPDFDVGSNNVHRWFYKTGFVEGLNKLQHTPALVMSIRGISVSYFLPYAETSWGTGTQKRILRCKSPMSAVAFSSEPDGSFSPVQVAADNFVISWSAENFSKADGDRFYILLHSTRSLPAATFPTIRRADSAPNVPPKAGEMLKSDGSPFMPVNGNTVQIILDDETVESWLYMDMWKKAGVKPNRFVLSQITTKSKVDGEPANISWSFEPAESNPPDGPIVAFYRVSPFENVNDGTGGYVSVNLPSDLATARIAFIRELPKKAAP